MRNTLKTCGISPKVIASAITGLITYLLTRFAIEIDPAIEQLINIAAMIIAGYVAPPGDVVTASEGDPSDDVLDASVEARLRHQADGYSPVEALLVVSIVMVILAVLFRL